MKKILFLCNLLFIIPIYLFFISSSSAANPCDNPANQIVEENCKVGNPISQWDITKTGSATVEGFATDISYNKGQTARFKIKTVASSYRIDIYRLGYYGGAGARKVTSVNPSTSLPQTQPDCNINTSVGLYDCANWAESASWEIPNNAVSGAYLAKVVRTDPEDGRANHIFFVVRDDNSHAPILFQTSDTTWQSYNKQGGWSLYFGPDNKSNTRAYKVSYNRPFEMYPTFGPGFRTGSGIFASGYNMIRWLERNGFDMVYFTGVDTDRRGADILNHKLFLSVGHDEYWSGQQRLNVESARDQGVNLAFFSGNEVYWKTRWEDNHRTMVTYKETSAAKLDPMPGVWTGLWRNLTGAQYDAGKPENALTGTIMMACCGEQDPMTVSSEEGKMRLWRNTSVATLTATQSATFKAGTLGHEWDEDWDNGFRPAGLINLSTTYAQKVFDITTGRNGYIIDTPEQTGPQLGNGLATHHLTLYKNPSGALVFGAGTVNLPYALDNYLGVPQPILLDPRLQQAVVNLFADMDVQPGNLQANLVQATKSTDNTAPTTTITSPTNNANLPVNNTIAITGTTTDTGGVVAGVEVSVDNGVKWHPAFGKGSWVYNWTPTQTGTQTIKVRATDDSANIETPKERTVTITLNPFSNSTQIFIHAAGTPAEGQFPSMVLYVNELPVKTFNNIRGNFAKKDFEVYGYTHPAAISASRVRVTFVNDRWIDINNDRNLYIDKAVINGINYPTISSTTISTGTYFGSPDGRCTEGVATKNVLNCAGSFYFNFTPTPPTGSDTAGLVKDQTAYLRNVNSAGGAHYVYAFNYSGTYLACDWDGDGKTTLGVFNNGSWTIRNIHSANATQDITIQYGTTGDTPVCGDWDGDGKDTIGVYKTGFWRLRNTNSAGTPDIAFGHGITVNSKPVIGDWDRDGKDTIGLVEGSRWFLRNSLSTGNPDWVINFNYPGTPIAGDWNNDGRDTPGMYYVNGTWTLRNTLTNDPSSDQSFVYGYAKYFPVPGDWNNQ